MLILKRRLWLELRSFRGDPRRRASAHCDARGRDLLCPLNFDCVENYFRLIGVPVADSPMLSAEIRPMMGARRAAGGGRGAVLRLQPPAARPGQSPGSQDRLVRRPFGGSKASGAVLRRDGPPFDRSRGMIRMLIVGYGFGIGSERRLCEEAHLNLAYRWFCRLGLDGGVPDY